MAVLGFVRDLGTIVVFGLMLMLGFMANDRVIVRICIGNFLTVRTRFVLVSIKVSFSVVVLQHKECITEKRELLFVKKMLMQYYPCGFLLHNGYLSNTKHSLEF